MRLLICLMMLLVTLSVACGERDGVVRSMAEPTAPSAAWLPTERVSVTVAGPSSDSLAKPTPSARQLREWHETISATESEWGTSLEGLEPAAGYSLVTMTFVDMGSRRVVVGVNCDDSVEPVQSALLAWAEGAGVPPSVIDVRIEGRVRSAAVGSNRLEECVVPHLAGFGGYYLEGSDEVYVFLLHPSPEAAEAVLTYQLGADFPLRERTIYPMQGDFTYTELEGWHGRFLRDWFAQHVRDGADGYAGVVTLPGYQGLNSASVLHSGTNVRLNRLVFRLDPGSDVTAVGDALAGRLDDLGIPREAVVISAD